MELSFTQKFEMEKTMRIIDSCDDIEEMKKLARQFYSAWQVQSNFSKYYGAMALGLDPKTI